jgi:hypothetical protein
VKPGDDRDSILYHCVTGFSYAGSDRARYSPVTQHGDGLVHEIWKAQSLCEKENHGSAVICFRPSFLLAALSVDDFSPQSTRRY